MGVTATMFNHAKYLAATGALDLSTGDIKMMLVASGYTPDFDVHDYKDDVTNELATANGYTQGGATLTYSGVTRVGKNASTDKTEFKSERVEFIANGGQLGPRRAILYKDTGVASTSPLLVSILLDDTAGGTDVTVNDQGKLVINCPAAGWITF
jgi:hypothetical protein